jgi:methylglutaconyl-CoA hydratase
VSGLVAATVRDGVGYLRLTRSDKRNALSHALVDEALAAMDGFTAAGVEVAVLEGDAPTFCAGNDLIEARADRDRPAADRFLGALLERPLLWIARLDCPALGAGVAVVAVCPVVVATPGAWLALPERDIGLFPTGVLTHLEPFAGARASFDLGLTGRRLEPTEAQRLGLVNVVVEPAALDEAIAGYVATAVAKPGVAAAGREAWQDQFRTVAARERAGQLARILAAQSFDTPADERTTP